MNDMVLPQKISCGYFDCSEFAGLRVSPEREAKGNEIEYFLEDGKVTFLNGKEMPIRADSILVAKAGDRRYSLLPFRTAFLKFEAVGALSAVLDRLPCCFAALHKKQLRQLLHEIITVSESGSRDTLLLAGKFFTLLSFIVKDGEAERRGTNYNYAVMHSA